MTDLTNAEVLSLLLWPMIASLILPWLLVYLGLHIVQRGVIFVDLALAQTAAFGTCLSLLAGYDVHDWQSYAFSLVFTCLGSVVLTFTRTAEQKAPQEALIGIVYVVTAAAAILILSKSPGESHELQRSLVGELLVVPHMEVIRCFILFLIIGCIHYKFRKQFLAISANPAAAAASGLNLRLWDFFFYLLFGLVVTSFVHIAGVLLVFSYLVIPAVCSLYLAKSFVARFLLGWGIATTASVMSILVTTRVDLPIGAAVVCTLGLALIGVMLGNRCLGKKTPRIGNS